MAANDFSYIILSPPRVENSAGIRFLYDLAKDIRNLGYNAWITSDIKETLFTNDPDERVIPFSKALGVIRFGKAIAVYPEVIFGNPLRSSRVTRIIGNKPGYLGGATDYAKEEKVFLYSECYRNYLKGEVFGTLYKPNLDTNVFTNWNPGPRLKKLYYVGKGSFNQNYIDNTYIEISRSHPPRKDLPSLFNDADHIIVFDNSTALVQEAALCGCLPIVIPDGSFDRKDLQNFELGDTGVAWGVSDERRARASLPFLRQKIEDQILAYGARLTNFIEETQERWPNRVGPLDEDSGATLESMHFEREIFWIFRNNLKRRFGEKLDLMLRLEEESLHGKALLWGVDKTSLNAIRLLQSCLQVVGIFGEDVGGENSLNQLGIPIISKNDLNQTDFDFIIVVSLQRQSAKMQIEDFVRSGQTRVIYLTRDFSEQW